jgi:hypothetical protein
VAGQAKGTVDAVQQKIIPDVKKSTPIPQFQTLTLPEQL